LELPPSHDAFVEMIDRGNHRLIELPLAAHYPAQIRPGMTVQLNDGNRIIGIGRVEEVVEP